MAIERAQLSCRTCGEMRLFERVGVNHGLHFLVSFFTCGAWLPGWIAIAFANRANAFCCTACAAPEQADPPRRPSPAWMWIVGATVLLMAAPVVIFWLSGVEKSERRQPAAEATPALQAPREAESARELEPGISAEEAAQRRAVARYPELGVAGSPLNREFLRRVQQYRAERPEFFADPEWPSALARECAEQPRRFTPLGAP